MDVFANGKIQNQFRKLRYNSTMEERRGLGDRDDGGGHDKDEDGIYHQTFTHHWEACRDRIRDYEPLGERCGDDVLTVSAQLEQMIQLLQLEISAGNNNKETRILDTILSDSDNILAQIVAWSKGLPSGGEADTILSHLLQLCDVLVGCRQSGQSVVYHAKVVQPLLALLDIVNNAMQRYQVSRELQSSLLNLIHSLCVLLMESPSLLELFTCNKDTTGPKFLLFTLLTPFLHKPSHEGQLARDSLLLCISLSSQHPIVQTFITDHSNFCTILATGLSGLYSELPRVLDTDNPGTWHRLDPDDDVPGLSDMVTSLQLCSAVLQVASHSISSQLLLLIHQGFLVPVLGPALVHETEVGTVVSSTLYVDLFIRTISSPPLLATLVKFILTESVDGKNILDVLISRLTCSGQVCVVTLQLFETLVSLNMEDVMVSLVFKHLSNCNFLLPSLRSKLNYVDPHGRAAYKFLSLVPVSCDPPATPVTPRRTPFFSPSSPSQQTQTSQSYTSYLSDAHLVIRQTHLECSFWNNCYDGHVSSSSNNNQNTILNPSLNRSPKDKSKLAPKISIELGHDVLMEESGDSGPGSLGDTSGYLSGGWDLDTDVQDVCSAAGAAVLSQEEEEEFWSAVGYPGSRQRLVSVLARLQHEDRLSMSSYGSEEISSPRNIVTEQQSHNLDNSPASLGPFLTTVLNRVSSFADNGLGVNLRLTALVSKLACYPQPLLKCVLLHPDIVVQPSCSTLFQAICTARQRIDSIMPGLLGADEAVRSAKDDLHSRVEPGRTRSASTASLISLPASLDASFRKGSSLLKMFSKQRTPTSSPGGVTSTGVSSPGNSVPAHTRKMAMAAVLMEEWLQELAALAQEHSVLLQQEKIFHYDDFPHNQETQS